jgi:hypothetical protein
MELLQNPNLQRRTEVVRDSDLRWLLAKRIAESDTFTRSDRLSSLLLYVCRLHIAGRNDEINEQRIGIEVFGRKPSFDSGADSIVRSHASRLRRRLEIYFQTEGSNEPVRVEIPPGGYIPRYFSIEERGLQPEHSGRDPSRCFAELGISPLEESSTVSPAPRMRAEESGGQRSLPWLKMMTALIAVSLIVAVAFAFLKQEGKTLSDATPNAGQTSVERDFWNGLLENGAPSLVVTGDSGLVLYETYAKREVTLSDYLAGTYRAPDPNLRGNRGIAYGDLAGRRYTSVADLNLAIRLSHLPQWSDQRDHVVFARDLSASEASASNLILIGSRTANPWDSLVDGTMNFVLTPDNRGHFYFLNRHPVSGEKEIYAPSKPGNMSDSSVYALICYRPNIPGMSKVLLLSGLWLSGTQAAGEFVLNDREFSRFLASIVKPDGSIPPFELLVQIRSVAGNALNYSIIARRIG